MEPNFGNYDDDDDFEFGDEELPHAVGLASTSAVKDTATADSDSELEIEPPTASNGETEDAQG